MDSQSDVTKILETPPAAAFGNAEDLVSQFQQAWQSDSAPDLSAFVLKAPQALQASLVERLLTIELDERVARRELPDLSRYLQVLGEHESLVRAEFGRRTIDQYFRGRCIGSGGMGEVFVALHMRLRRHAAVKTLFVSEKNDNLRRMRFEREMYSAGQLDHCNVIRTEHAGLWNGMFFLAMELIDGPNLADLVKQNRRLSIADACELIRQACAGLEHIAAHGLVHRDLKPGNLMLAPDGTAKILDLGLARVTDDEAIQDLKSAHLGTVDYMGPEQCRNAKNADIRTDIYSLGCTLFHLLVGQPPYPAPRFPSAFEKMSAHSSDQPPPWLCDRLPGAPEALAEVVRRMMAKRPADRYQTPLEAEQALEQFCAGHDLRALRAGYVGPALRCRENAISTVRNAHETTEVLTPSTDSSNERTSDVRSFIRRARTKVAWGLLGIIVTVALALAVLRPWQPRSALTLEQNLGSLPGLHGQWWFDDMGRYLPILRQELAEQTDPTLLSGQPARLDAGELAELKRLLNSHDVKALESKLFEFSPQGDQEFLSGLCEKMDSRGTEIKKFRKQLGEVRDQLIERIGSQTVTGQKGSEPATTRDKATNLHLLGLIHHKLATFTSSEGERIDSRAEMWAKAEASYTEAIRTYKEMASPLVNLCRADLGRMHFDKGDYQTAVIELGKVNETTPLLEIWALCWQADALREDSKWARASVCLQKAEKQATEILPPNHPLLAYVHECCGWYYERHACHRNSSKDAQDAEKHFLMAKAIREITRADERSRLEWFHDRHAIAMLLQFRGKDAQENFAKAKHEFKSILADLDSAIDDSIGDKDELDLLQRQLNTLERQADCFLHGQPEAFADAATLYKNAIKFVRSKKDLVTTSVGAMTVCQMTCKQAIAEALGGNSSEGELLLAGLKTFEQKSALTKDELQANELIRLVAQTAVAAARQKVGSSPEKPLIDYFVQHRQDESAASLKMNREEKLLLILLFRHWKVADEVWAEFELEPSGA